MRKGNSIVMRPHISRHSLVYCALGALSLAGSLNAALISTVRSSGGFIDLSETFGCSDAGTTTAACSVSAGGSAFHNASGLYQADADYGMLNASSRSDVYDLNLGELLGTSSASFSDTFLLTGGIGSGTLIFVTEYWGYGQSESCPCVSNSTVTLNSFTGHPDWGLPVITNLPFTFSFGTLFNLNASVSAYSSALGDELATQTAHLKIDAIEVRDSNGALLTNYSVTTGSGASYPFVTPEAGTFALVTGALVAIMAIRKSTTLAGKVGR